MAIIKCKMCGGDIELSADKTYGVCDYCGSTMTLPKIDDEQRAAAFNRGNHFRRIGEFDKALAVYERIVREDDRDAEAHWCCALCRFGIEYVEDPASFEYIPTCHRASFDSFLEDVDYLAAVEHSDGITKRQYQKDGARIAEVQRGILATSQKEEPYDVFICYKETDENGERTRDSIMAQEIYYQLTEQGRRVFFARITLEDMGGREYEPYIFAALNSAKVMVVVGTKPEHLSAVWVKNEWSRFLAMMRHDRNKLLLPCYRDMDPYDLPEQLSVLQSYDMGKIGFIQDLTRGIAKVLNANKKPESVREVAPAAVKAVQATVVANAGVTPLLERAFMFLEDGEWDRADEFCEQVLNMNPKCAEAYLGKLLAELRVRKKADLKDQAKPFDGRNNYQKAVRFADEDLRTELTGYIEHINTRNEIARVNGIYNRAKNVMSAANTESEYKVAAQIFETIPQYLDAVDLVQECYEKAEIARKDAILAEGKSKMTGEDIYNYEPAIKLFKSISGWRDADEQIVACQKKIAEYNAKAVADRLERKRQAELARQQAERIKKRNMKIAGISAAVLAVAIAIPLLVSNVIIPITRYNNAIKLMETGKYEEAISAFEVLDGYKDSADQIKECEYRAVVALVDTGKTAYAAIAFDALGRYKDAKEQSRALWDVAAVRDTVSASTKHTVGLKADGTVVAVGDNGSGQCDVSQWSDIVAVSAGENHTVGLKADGTVVAVGSNINGQCRVSRWKNIVAVSVGKYHTVGLRADGTVVAVGWTEGGQCRASEWSDIVAVSAGENHTVGLKADGTVVAVGKNGDGQCEVSDWSDIVAVSATEYQTVGLKADGTVVAIGDNEYGQCDVSEWSDIVAVSAGKYHTVGLKADGTVVAVGYGADGRCNVSEWSDIVAVSAGGYQTVGLKADGSMVVVGSNGNGQCDISDWESIQLP